MTKTAIEVLEELEATAGSNAKRDILELNRKNEILQRAFVAALDPYVVYYVNKFRLPRAVVRQASDHDTALVAFFGILGKLSSRSLTGNAARDAVEDFFKMLCLTQQKWCQRIILKNLRCGVQDSTVNKVWPGLVKGFSVALAETLGSEFVRGEGIRILDQVTYPVRVEPKLDGLRCIAVKQSGAVTLFTRSGKTVDTLPKIVAALEAVKHDSVVLDGEVLATSGDWNTTTSVMMAKKTMHDDSDMVFNVFDAVTLNEWVSQDASVPYSLRCKLVHDVVTACGSNNVVQVPHIMAQNEDELKAYFAKCMDEKFEGVMIKRMDTPYRFKRSDNILKLKPVVTYESVIVGAYEGRRGSKREGQFGGFEALFPNGVITKVGGGFNDATRAEIQLNGPDSYVGRIIEVEAQPDPLTKDGLSKDGKARFPVYTRFRDPSDVDPKVLAAYEAWRKL